MTAMDWGVIVFTLLAGAPIGAYLEWLDHRKYCDCKFCRDWRRRMATLAEKKP